MLIKHKLNMSTQKGAGLHSKCIYNAIENISFNSVTTAVNKTAHETRSSEKYTCGIALKNRMPGVAAIN